MEFDVADQNAGTMKCQKWIPVNRGKPDPPEGMAKEATDSMKDRQKGCPTL